MNPLFYSLSYLLAWLFKFCSRLIRLPLTSWSDFFYTEFVFLYFYVGSRHKIAILKMRNFISFIQVTNYTVHRKDCSDRMIPVSTGRLWDVFETSITYKRRLKDVFKTSCVHWDRPHIILEYSLWTCDVYRYIKTTTCLFMELFMESKIQICVYKHDRA